MTYYLHRFLKAEVYSRRKEGMGDIPWMDETWLDNGGRREE
jgi:hypothetical protein